jgi:hypothetical protein
VERRQIPDQPFAKLHVLPSLASVTLLSFRNWPRALRIEVNASSVSCCSLIAFRMSPARPVWLGSDFNAASIRGAFSPRRPICRGAREAAAAFGEAACGAAGALATFLLAGALVGDFLVVAERVRGSAIGCFAKFDTTCNAAL